MKTLEYVKKHFDDFEFDEFLDRRFTKRFLDFVPASEFENFGFQYTGEGEHEVKEWTEDNILAQLKEDCEFGIEKAVNHRGISASLMYDVCRAWCKILENGLDHIEYGYYGHSLFKAIDEMYNWGLVTEDTFDEDFFGDWS